MGYACFTILRQSDEITAKYSRNSLAVKLGEDDLAGWARHAILRSRSKGTGTAPAVSGSSGGRRARVEAEPIRFDGDPILVVIGSTDPGSAPRLRIEGAQWLAETFFSRDPSASGPMSYDTWIAKNQADPWLRDHIVEDDITAVNTTMAARTGHATWAPIVALATLPWLEAIDPEWDLVSMTNCEWLEARVGARLHDAFAATGRKGLGIAVVTKVLHIKRPRMIPVLDSLVLQQIGLRTSNNVATWVVATERVRAVGRANAHALDLIRGHLASRGIEGRSTTRILDALLWTSHPTAGLFSSLSGWERALRPRDG